MKKSFPISKKRGYIGSMKNQEMERLIKERLSEKRFQHSLRVRDEAVKLAKIHGCDVEKAEKAALLHDFCRNMSREESDSFVRRFDLDEKFLGNVSLAHSKVGAKLLREEYGIQDEEILLAVENHTTGRPGMTLLEKIIYVADAIEPGRNYPGLEELQKMAYNNIDAACLSALDRSIQYVLSKGERMDNSAISWKIAEVIDSKKGQDIVIIDISKTSGFADYLVITHAPSDRLMKTIADEVEDQLASVGVFLKKSEGKNGSGWILLDFGDIVVNVFSKEMREKYNLEKLWGDGEVTYFESK